MILPVKKSMGEYDCQIPNSGMTTRALSHRQPMSTPQKKITSVDCVFSKYCRSSRSENGTYKVSRAAATIVAVKLYCVRMKSSGSWKMRSDSGGMMDWVTMAVMKMAETTAITSREKKKKYNNI